MITVTFAFWCTLSLQDDIGEYYKFEKGTTWTYDTTENGTKGCAVFRVIETADASVHLEITKGEEQGQATWSLKNECFVWAMELMEGKEVGFRVLEKGAKEGDNWAGMTQATVDGCKAIHKGIKEVTVPAGTYEEALHIWIGMGGKHSWDMWWVPKVGLVKMETRIPESNEVYVLKEMKSEPVGENP